MVGAGIGGLATAARLLKNGYRVSIYEKEVLIGGRANCLKQAGFVFDTGPTILMMIEVLEAVFRDCGKRVEDYLELIKLEPNYQAKFFDGSGIVVSSNLPTFCQSLIRIDPKAPEQFYRFFGDIAKMYRLAYDQFIDKNFDKLTDFIGFSAGWELIRSRGLKNLHRFVSDYFDDPRLKMLFSFQSMYLGVSPYAAPAIYSIVSYMETGLGIWYLKGGIYQLPKALGQLVKDLGGTITTNAPVKTILIDKGKVIGIELTNGRKVSADLIISNADLVYTYSELLDKKYQAPFMRQRLTKLKQASSALVFNWGVHSDLNNLEHHNVYFAREFKKNLDQIFDRGELPDDPSFYVSVPTKSDPTLAPKNSHVVYILVPVPNLTADIDWSKATSKIKKVVLARLQQTFGVNLVGRIKTEAVFTPHDFKNRFNLPDGTAFGLSHYFFQSGYFRPHNVVSKVKGLYLVGASTYPGSGIPMVILSAKLVVERILQDARL